MSKPLNGLDVRQFPKARFECLRYQIGRFTTEHVKTGRFKTSMERVFRLVAWGHDREAAMKMLMRVNEGK